MAEPVAPRPPEAVATARLLRAVAHDLNNLLHVVCGGVSALAMDLPPDTDPLLVEDIATAGRQAVALVDRLYVHGRAVTEPAQPQALLDVFLELDSRLPETVSVELPDEALQGCLDPYAFGRVLSDLGQVATAALPGRPLRLWAQSAADTTVVGLSAPEDDLQAALGPVLDHPFAGDRQDGSAGRIELAVLRAVVEAWGGSLAWLPGPPTTLQVRLRRAAGAA